MESRELAAKWEVPPPVSLAKASGKMCKTAGAASTVAVSCAATVAGTCRTAREATAAVAMFAGNRASATCSLMAACRAERRLEEACSASSTSDS